MCYITRPYQTLGRCSTWFTGCACTTPKTSSNVKESFNSLSQTKYRNGTNSDLVGVRQMKRAAYSECFCQSRQFAHPSPKPPTIYTLLNLSLSMAPIRSRLRKVRLLCVTSGNKLL